MSAATEQQNNGDVAVEKIAADAVKDDLKSQKADVEESKPVAADNGTASKDEVHEDEAVAPVKEHVKGTKRPSEAKNSESKKAKKEKVHDSDDDVDEEEIIEEESDEYDIPYDGDDDDIECDDDDDDNDDVSGSDDQA